VRASSRLTELSDVFPQIFDVGFHRLDIELDGSE